MMWEVVVFSNGYNWRRGSYYQKDRNPGGVMSRQYLLGGHVAKGEGGKLSCLILKDIYEMAETNSVLSKRDNLNIPRSQTFWLSPTHLLISWFCSINLQEIWTICLFLNYFFFVTSISQSSSLKKVPDLDNWSMCSDEWKEKNSGIEFVVVVDSIEPFTWHICLITP